MATCPRCQFANPDGAASCAGCGYTWPASGPPPTAGDAPPAPLPPPMLEPVLTPEPAGPPRGTPLPSEPNLTIQLRNGPGRPKPADPVTAAPPPAGPSVSAHAPLTLQDAAPSVPAAPRTVYDRPTAPAAPAPAAVDPPAPPPPPPPPAIRPKLVVLRGQKVNAEYPVYEGRNTVGRFADKPVDIDLMTQEAVEQIWSSRQHAVVTLDKGTVFIEDLNSLNGTWVNGARIHPGQQRPLKPNDVIQVGTVQLRLVIG